MMDPLLSILIVVMGLLIVGSGLGLLRRSDFSLRWLFVAGGLVFLNDVLLTNFYGYLPQVLGETDWNWQGKLLALAGTLAIASHPAFGWQRSGLALRQVPGSIRPAMLVAALYCLFFLGLALLFPNENASRETVAFQLTMPGFEEEPFYRGILLLSLNEAFRSRARILGIDWGWGALISCILFGLTHAFSFSVEGGVNFDAMTMGLTAIPSLLAVWLRERTGSLLLPVLMHNFGNSIMLLV